jgi:hypothetical protein
MIQHTTVRMVGMELSRAVASFALDLGLSAPALEARNSPCGLRQHASPLAGTLRCGRPGSLALRHAPVRDNSIPTNAGDGTAEGMGLAMAIVDCALEGGGVARRGGLRGLSGAKPMEVRSDRTPEPGRE